MEYFQIKVNDKPFCVKGVIPHIETLEGYLIPLSMICGLPYMQMRPYKDGELDKYRCIHITADAPWNPKVLDKIVPDEWYATTESTLSLVDGSPFDEHGKLRNGDTGSNDGEVHPDDDKVELECEIKTTICKSYALMDAVSFKCDSVFLSLVVNC